MCYQPCQINALSKTIHIYHFSETFERMAPNKIKYRPLGAILYIT